MPGAWSARRCSRVFWEVLAAFLCLAIRDGGTELNGKDWEAGQHHWEHSLFSSCGGSVP